MHKELQLLHSLLMFDVATDEIGYSNTEAIRILCEIIAEHTGMEPTNVLYDIRTICGTVRFKHPIPFVNKKVDRKTKNMRLDSLNTMLNGYIQTLENVWTD